MWRSVKSWDIFSTVLYWFLFFLYWDFFYSDDMCHLAPYAKNITSKHETELTKYFGDMKMAVDFLHFKVKRGNISKYVVFFKLFRIMLGKTVRSFITPTSMMNLSPWIPSCVNNRYSWCSNYFHLNSSQISVPLHQPPYQCEGWFLDIFNTLSWEKHWLIT